MAKLAIIKLLSINLLTFDGNNVNQFELRDLFIVESTNAVSESKNFLFKIK